MTKEITSKIYQNLVNKIQTRLIVAQENLARQKIETSWEIGQLVSNFLQKNSGTIYGKNLFKNLENDIGIASKTLYKMHVFYQSYPTLPAENSTLKWSHYRLLAGIKNEDDRKYLENLTEQNSWKDSELQQKISEIKTAKSPQNNSDFKVKLNVTRGKLFTYKIAQLNGVENSLIDCGFKIFHKSSTQLEPGTTALSVKKNGKYSLEKTKIPRNQLYNYKAFLDRVIDGDTIRVNLDLGFGIFHRETLRLAQINAPESKTPEGKKSTKALEKILQDASFLIVKTNKIDIYGRYIAEVFFDNNAVEGDENKVAQVGTHLNQLILDSKLAQFVSY